MLKSVAFDYVAAEWEFTSSPIIYNGVLIIQCDVLENSFVAAYDVKTGKELWKTQRDEYPGWCTPNIYSNAGKTYVALNGYKNRGGYDFETGKEICMTAPSITDGMILFRTQKYLVAIGKK